MDKSVIQKWRCILLQCESKPRQLWLPLGFTVDRPSIGTLPSCTISSHSSEVAKLAGSTEGQYRGSNFHAIERQGVATPWRFVASLNFDGNHRTQYLMLCNIHNDVHDVAFRQISMLVSYKIKIRQKHLSRATRSSSWQSELSEPARLNSQWLEGWLCCSLYPIACLFQFDTLQLPNCRLVS